MDAFSLIQSFFFLLLFTSFIKIFCALSIFRYGIGLQSGSFGLVTVAISLVLTLVVIEPQLNQAGGMQALVSNPNQNKTFESFKPFIEQQTDPKIKERFVNLIKKSQSSIADTDQDPKAQLKINPAKSISVESNNLSLAAFLVSELKKAFELGLIFLIPFFVIDLLVTNVLMLLSITQISAQIVSLPLKILLFVAIDGWVLISEKLLNSYLQ